MGERWGGWERVHVHARECVCPYILGSNRLPPVLRAMVKLTPTSSSRLPPETCTVTRHRRKNGKLVENQSTEVHRRGMRIRLQWKKVKKIKLSWCRGISACSLSLFCLSIWRLWLSNAHRDPTGMHSAAVVVRGCRTQTGPIPAGIRQPSSSTGASLD